MQQRLNIVYFSIDIINIICQNLSLLDILNFKSTGSFFLDMMRKIELDNLIVKLYDYEDIYHAIKIHKFVKYDLSDIDSNEKIINKSYFKIFKNCQYLNFGYNYSINDSILSYFRNCKQFISHSINITDSGLQNLDKCKSCDLSSCYDVTGKGFKYLANCENFYFTHNLRYDGTGIEYLKNCCTIDLTNCIGISNFENFSLLVNCHTINISKTEIKDIDLQYISHIKNVILIMCLNITGIGLEYLQNSSTIDISYCISIPPTSVGLHYLKNCRRLRIKGCKIKNTNLTHLANCEIISC